MESGSCTESWPIFLITFVRFSTYKFSANSISCSPLRTVASLKNPVEVRTIAFNFDQEASAYESLAEQLKDIEIGVLGK